MDYTLTDEEYWAVKDYIDAHMDGLEWPVKAGLLKLINGECHRQAGVASAVVEAARVMGGVTSERKKATSAENGKKGGRPRKFNR